MKRAALTLSLIFAALLAALPAASAQSQAAIVVLPFNASGGASAYSYGLATALGRSLNVIDGVYVPPVGDSYLLTQRLIDQEQATPENIVAAFGAEVLVSGQINASGNTAEVQIGFDGPGYSEVKKVAVSGALNNPDDIVGKVVNAVVAELGLGINAEDRSQLGAVVGQTPSLPSLTAVGQAALRLPSLSLSDLRAAAELDGDSSWVLSELARAQLLNGDAQAALDASLRAIQAGPNDIEALVTRGGILSSTGDEATALQAFDAALELNPDHALALQGKADLTDDLATAIQLYERALNIYPRLIDAYLGLAQAQNAQSPQRALQTLRRAAQDIPDSIRLRRAIVNQAIELGDPGGALSYIQGELTGEAAASPALYTLVMELPRPEYTDEALAVLEQGRQAFPESTSLVLAEATLLEETGDLAGAEAALESALAANKGNAGPELLNQLAIVQAKQGKTGEAEATLKQASGHNETLQFNLAQLYLNAGQSQAALEVLQDLVQRSPNDAEAFALYGVALGRVGRYDQALNALDQALALEPELELAHNARELVTQQQSITGGRTIELQGEAASAFQSGLAALEQGEVSQAARQFSHALELQDNGLIAFYKGYTLQLQGELRQAVPAYERALQDFPESDVVLNNLGLAYRSLGRYDLALEHFNRAVEANPDNANAQLNLGLTNYELGRYSQAVAALEQAIAADPAYADLRVDVGGGEPITLAQLVEQAANR